MSKRGENIRKRSDGRWESRLLDKKIGKYRYFYGKTYSEAKQKRNEYSVYSEKAKEANKSVSVADILLSEVFSVWLSEHGNTVKLSTYSNYTYITNKHLIPLLGGMTVADLTVKRINDTLYEWLHSDGALLSEKYSHDIISVLKSALSFAVERYSIDLTVNDILSVSVSGNDIEVLSSTEQRNLLNYLNDCTDMSAFGIILCLYTGMRIGEICALKWSDIHLDEGFIAITKTIYRTKNILGITVNGKIPKTIIKIGKPKTKASVRKIPLCSFLSESIKSMGEHNPEDYVLTNKSEYIKPRTFQNHFKKYLKKAGIKDVNFHILRHTFATNCVDVGCDVKTLSDILGHSSVKITLDKYVHSSIGAKKNQLEKLVVYKF